MRDDALVEQVIQLVAKHALIQSTNLSIDTKIGEDLRVAGDDADELLTEFAAVFGVDMSGMDFATYFPEEASSEMHYYLTTIAKKKYNSPVTNTVRFLESSFWRLFAKKEEYKTLTIGDLVRVASNRKW